MSDLTELLRQQLSDDAADETPPFGAQSVRLAQQMGREATPLLLQQLDADAATALLALEGLRESDPAAYGELPVAKRAAIHARALGKFTFFNTWGLPGVQVAATADALIALGNDAIRELAPLLDDERAAPSSGSQDATTSSAYGNRVCDYAWVLISEILGRRYRYSKSPRTRDREIAKLRTALSKRQQD